MELLRGIFDPAFFCAVGFGVGIGAFAVILVPKLFDSFAEGVFVHVHLLDTYFLSGFVGFAGEVLVDVVEDWHGLGRNYFSEDRVFAVEIRCFFQRDKELAAISEGTCIGHTQNTWFTMSEFWMKFVLKGLTEDALSSRTSTSGISSLHAKVLHEAMEGESIVIAVFTEF